jgi:hypothetical protein
MNRPKTARALFDHIVNTFAIKDNLKPTSAGAIDMLIDEIEIAIQVYGIDEILIKVEILKFEVFYVSKKDNDGSFGFKFERLSPAWIAAMMNLIIDYTKFKSPQKLMARKRLDAMKVDYFSIYGKSFRTIEENKVIHDAEIDEMNAQYNADMLKRPDAKEEAAGHRRFIAKRKGLM